MFSGVFISNFSLSFLYFRRAFNKTIIPLALVGYEMVIGNIFSHIQRALVE